MIKEIVTVKQVVNEKQVEYQTTINSSERAKNLGIQEIGFEAQEVVLVVAINSQNKVNAIYRAFKGSAFTTTINPSEIFRTVIMNNATKIMLYHNHPSLTSAEPSEADIQATELLLEGARILNIEFLDHIIVSGNEAFSFKENQLM